MGGGGGGGVNNEPAIITNAMPCCIDLWFCMGMWLCKYASCHADSVLLQRNFFTWGFYIAFVTLTDDSGKIPEIS